MPLGDVLYEPGILISHLHFPTTAIVSITCVLIDGQADAIALIGSEGVTGTEAFLGGNFASTRAVVLREGRGYRIRRELLEKECRRSDSIRELLLLYAQAHITHVAQTSVCNRHHSIDQRLCRWLLLLWDRCTSADISLTQERIAELMGVRRGSVMAIA